MQLPKGQLSPPPLPSTAGRPSPPTRPADPAAAPMSDHRFSSVPTEEEPGCCHLSRKAKVCLGVLLCVLVAVAVVVGVLKWPRAPPPRAWNGTGSTPHFSEIVLGRCFTYTQLLRPELG